MIQADVVNAGEYIYTQHINVCVRVCARARACVRGCVESVLTREEALLHRNPTGKDI